MNLVQLNYLKEPFAFFASFLRELKENDESLTRRVLIVIFSNKKMGKENFLNGKALRLAVF